MEKTDVYLVKRSQEGDARSFELLVIKYQKRIFNVVFRVVRNRDVVEDLAQEAFLNAFKSIRSFKGGSSFYTWLYRIAANVSINYLAKQKRASFADEGLLETEEVANRASGWESSPERSVQSIEASKAISESINALPSDIRQTVILREYDGLSYEEISEVMECPIGTVRSRIFRGREILKEKLRDYL